MAYQFEEKLAPFDIPPALLLGAKSRLSDRIAPAIERIVMPRHESPRGALRVEIDSERSVSKGARSRRQRLFGTVAAPIVLGEDLVCFDIRQATPENWAHCVYFLQLALFIRKEMEGRGDRRRLHIIVSSRTTRKAIDVFEGFGFSAERTDRPVEGVMGRYEVTPPMAARSRRGEWFGELSEPWLSDFLATKTDGAPLEKNLFLSRKDSRRLINEDDVEAKLSELGFRKVYAEEYSAADQFAMMQSVEKIVAIHGAALAPLWLRKKSQPPFWFVEIFTPGHIATSFRIMTAQLGGGYASVRGRITSDHARDAMKEHEEWRKHSTSDFDVCLDCLDYAIEFVEEGKVAPDF